ncbi:glycine dehydrogenase [Pedobacter sp. BAL39]|uniref:hypothetical protein n=1 Tax=Pedobacter sp. BAL39 TaxID=391596 RepID=UPI000155966D|nr:hypothetical protein [Pedobacter sp. BAL39]EDM35677.1 glycine dehydrogenase [Pedobacter sp. BAL39]
MKSLKKAAPFSLLVFSLFLLIAGCKGGGNLDESTATEVITAHLKNKPQFETVRINLGTLKFRGRNDQPELDKYKKLEGKGLVELSLQSEKKRLLAKDSLHIYQVSLTQKANEYVLKQDGNKATVRALNYALADEKPIKLIKGDSRVAHVTTSLKKEKNDFSILLKDRDAAGNFVTKTYKLKFKKEQGWMVAGE